MAEKITSDGVHTSRLTQEGAYWLLAAILVVAPLFRAGQEPAAMLALQGLALALLVVVLWTPAHGRLTGGEVLGLALVFVLPLAYLIPIPGTLVAALPGRDQYEMPLSLAGLDPGNALGTVSLKAMATEMAWLVLLVPVAVFLGARTLDAGRLSRLVLVLLGVAALEATLGLMQFGGGPESPLYHGMEHTHFGSAVGTYTNRNHLAGLLYMVLPIALGLLLYSLGRRGRERTASWRTRLSFFGSVQGNAALIYGALALLLLVGVIFTRSRTGIALTMLGVLLATFAYARRIGGTNVYGPAGTVAVVALGIGIAIGLAPVLERFSALDPMDDARWTIFSATLSGVGAYFPLGSGPGTYPDAFQAYQPLELGRWFINHAHNDYLEWLFEVGLAAALVLAVLLVLYLRQWSRVWTREEWSRFRFIQVGAGIGILLLLLHGWVDYNLRIPANIVYFAFLAGIFFSRADQDDLARERRRRTRRTPDLKPASPAGGLGGPAAVTPEDIKNPFLD